MNFLKRFLQKEVSDEEIKLKAIEKQIKYHLENYEYWKSKGWDFFANDEWDSYLLAKQEKAIILEVRNKK